MNAIDLDGIHYLKNGKNPNDQPATICDKDILIMKTAKGKILGGARPGSGRKPGTENKKAVTAYLKPEQHRRLLDAAKAQGKSSSALITEAIEKYLNDKIMGQEISYEGYQVLVREDNENWYVDFQTGLGEGIYPKDSFSLEQALKDQMNIYNENPDD